MDIHFRRGLVLGGIIGSLAALFASSERSKETRTRVRRDLEDMYANIRTKLEDVGTTTQEAYDRLVDKTIDDYSKSREYTLDVRERISGELKKRWLELQTIYLYTKLRVRLKRIKDLTRMQYDNAVDELLDEYGENKELARETVRNLRKKLREKWEEFRRDVKSEDEDLYIT